MKHRKIQMIFSVVLVLFVFTCAASLVQASNGQGNLPAAVDINPDPKIFETNFVAMEAQVDLGNGLLANANTFNGAIPGPELRLKVGDRVIVHFTNRLPVPSSIHWHGVEVNNVSDGTGVTQDQVPPGGTYTYKFVVPRPGVFWYHSHIMPTNPEFKGLYGSFIVEDPAEKKLIALGVIPNLGHTKTLVLSDVTVCKTPGQNDTATFPAISTLPWAGGTSFPGLLDPPTPQDLCEYPRDNQGNLIPGADPLAAGEIPNIQSPQGCTAGSNPPCRVNEGQMVLANGLVPAARTGSPSAPGALESGAAVINVKAGEGVRLQMINAAVTRYFRLLMTNKGGTQVTLYRIGGEGGLLDKVRVEGGTQGTLVTKYDAGEIVLAPGDREDVVFVVPDGKIGDVVTLWTLDYSRTGQGFAKIPTVPVAHFRIVDGASKNNRFTIAQNDSLRIHPAVNAPIENLKGLTITDHLLDPATFSPALPGSADETIQFLIAAGMPSIDGVNGSDFDEGAPANFEAIPHIASSRYAFVGDLLELTISDETSAHHPFHPHGFSIQPVRLIENAGGTTVYSFDYNEFVDTFDVPAGHSLVFRTRLDDRPLEDFVSSGGAEGRWVFHCHIFFHAAHGMISELVVLKP